MQYRIHFRLSLLQNNFESVVPTVPPLALVSLVRFVSEQGLHSDYEDEDMELMLLHLCHSLLLLVESSFLKF
jgi:hypothetical protein